MITIIDYGVGNVGSIRNMFRKVGVPAEATSDPARVIAAQRLVLPGVGAFDCAMENLETSGLIAAVERVVLRDGRPLLAICLGMQLLTRRSEEGSRQGLGWVDAETLRFAPREPRVKVPHMGWARVDPAGKNPLFADMEDPRFYFLHSFYVRCNHSEDSAASTTYAGVRFDAAIHRGNIWGAQFHPEKSHRFGMQFFRNFATA